MFPTLKPDPRWAADSDDPSLVAAAASHLARNVEAFSDAVVAALYTVRDANAQIVRSSATVLSEQISAATAITAARTICDLHEAQREFGRQALRTCALSAETLRILLVAGAKAAKEPLLERLR